jgi:IS30 family transposase
MDGTNNNRDSVLITADLIKRVSDGMDDVIKTRPKDIFTKREMLVQLSEKIIEMRKAGFKIEEISEWIKQTYNVLVSPSTIRAAMSTHAKKQKRPKKLAPLMPKKTNMINENNKL